MHMRVHVQVKGRLHSPGIGVFACDQKTHVLVRDDLDALHVSGRLENLLQDILGHAWVKTSYVESSFVWLWCSSSDLTSCAGWRHETGAHGSWQRVGVLRDVDGEGHRWWRHVVARAIGEATLTRRCAGGGRLWELVRIGSRSVGHS